MMSRINSMRRTAIVTMGMSLPLFKSSPHHTTRELEDVNQISTLKSSNTLTIPSNGKKLVNQVYDKKFNAIPH